MFDSTCTLCTETVTQDEYLNEVKTYTGREVFVRKARSIYMNEFYQAAAQGLAPSVVLVIFFGDYDGEKVVRWERNDYTVTRTYRSPDSDNLELTLEVRLEPLDIEEVGQ